MTQTRTAKKEMYQDIKKHGQQLNTIFNTGVVDKILHYTDKGYSVFVNGDARGYALKIDSECVKDEALEIYKDGGGYGILAPDFSR